MGKGKYAREILEIAERRGHLTLIDPNKQDPERAVRIALEAERAGTDGIMVGGSIGIERDVLDETVRGIREACSVPVILFPGNIDGISKHAHLIFFMSLLNSSNPYWITGAQALAAPLIRKYGLDYLSMAYLVLEPGGAAGWVGEARLLPRSKPELVAAYCMAAEMLGFDLVYLEAGSGAPEPIPSEVVRIVRRSIEIPLVVGGGIRKPSQAEELVRAGANIIVTGTIVEEVEDIEKVLREIIGAVKSGRK